MPMTHIERPLEIADFLDQQGWGDASVHPFDGDFSSRRYARLTRPDGTALLMDADPDQKTPQFVAVAKILHRLEIAAPKIYAALPDQGLVLLQDLGTRNIGELLDTGNVAKIYFLRATEVLAKLHRGFDRSDVIGLDLPLYTTDLFVKQAELFLDAYFPFIIHRDARDDERADFRAAWTAVLRPLETMPKSLLLRDFMPDNLMDLPAHKIGVLDFQDAGIGPVAYDLASLCEVVRRDGGFTHISDVIGHYLLHTQNSLSYVDLLRACTLLSAQRHTRILGIIAQRATTKGRHDKLAFVSRIRQHLANILREPYLLPVRQWMSDFESIQP